MKSTAPKMSPKNHKVKQIHLQMTLNLPALNGNGEGIRRVHESVLYERLAAATDAMLQVLAEYNIHPTEVGCQANLTYTQHGATWGHKK